MGINKKADYRLETIPCRAEQRAKSISGSIPVYIRPLHKRLLEHMLSLENNYLKVSSLLEVMYGPLFAPNGKRIVDIRHRNNLQTALSVIRKLIKRFGYELREIKRPGDRRVYAIGIFSVSFPMTDQKYPKLVNLDSFIMDYAS